MIVVCIVGAGKGKAGEGYCARKVSRLRWSVWVKVYVELQIVIFVIN